MCSHATAQRAAARLLATILAATALLATAPREAAACKFEIKPWHELILGWRQTCGEALCGRVVELTGGSGSTAGSCADELPLLHLGRRLAEAAGHGGLALLGEVHDNADHHRLRALLLDEMGRSASGVRPAAVFEHIRADQQSALDEFAAKPGGAADLFSALDWGMSGWSEQTVFAPLVEGVIRGRLPIYAGDPPRAMIKKVAKEGEAALPGAERLRLRLDKPLPATSQDALLDDLEKSHCGLMPKTAFGKLAYAQRYRDASLADALLRAGKEHTSAILLAGNGHVRADRGVPWYIHARAPEKKVVAVLLLEVEEGKTKPEAYDLKGDDGQPIADFVIFTPRTERPDPCEDMKKRFGSHAK